MKRSAVEKDWFNHVTTPSGRRKIAKQIDSKKVKSIDDISQYITPQQVAAKLQTTVETVTDWMSKKLLQGIKIQGRWKTTAEWLNEFIEAESEKSK